MQATFVMLLALSGLGCHHKSCDVNCASTYCVPSYCDTSPRYAIEYETVVEPSCYSCCYTNCNGCVRVGCARDGWGPGSGGYVGCYAGGAIGCGCHRFPPHT
jgi:hypothetical protein